MYFMDDTYYKILKKSKEWNSPNMNQDLRTKKSYFKFYILYFFKRML